MNLCTNAFHAMEATGGRLDVILDSVENGPEEALGHHLDPGRYLKLTVMDTRSGMGADTISRIFDPILQPRNLGREREWGWPRLTRSSRIMAGRSW